MSIKEAVLAVLQSAEVSMVNFRLFGLAINGQHFLELHTKILSGQARVGKSNHLPSGTMGHWYPGSDTLLLRKNQLGFRQWRSVVVHESTHAVLDMKAAPVTNIQSEIIAYVAQMIFLRRCNYPFSSRPFRNSAVSTPALALADAVVRGAPSTHLIEALRDGILRHPNYEKLRVSGEDMAVTNGI